MRLHFARKPNFIFDSQSDNFKLRKVFYLRHKYYKNSIKFLQTKIKTRQNKLSQVHKIICLFHPKIIPNGTIIRLNKDFDQIVESEDSIKLFKHTKQIENLHNILINSERLIPRPLWFIDLNKFYTKLISEALKKYDAEIGYFPNIPEEVSFSRYLFCHPNSEIGKQIDRFINDQKPFDSFPEKVLSFCRSLSMKSFQKDETILVITFYRALVNRIYELYPERLHFSDQSFSTEPRLSSFNQLMKSLPGYDSNIQIRNLFLTYLINNKYIKECLNYANLSYYYVCPIDSIYTMNSLFQNISKGVNSLKITNREPTDVELNEMLSLEENVESFECIFLSSDIPNVSDYFKYLIKFAPAQMNVNLMNCLNMVKDTLSFFDGN